MKNKILTALSALALCASAFGATFTNPPSPAVNVFGVGTTNGSTALSWAIIGNRSANGGAPVITHINAGTDLGSAYVRFYKIDAYVQATLATNTSARIYVQNTNTSAANWQSGAVIIRHVTDDSYEKRLLTANDGSTNLILTVATLGAMVPGDLVYHAVSNSQPFIIWGAITNSLGNGGGPIFAGQKGLPLLVEIHATTAGGVNAVGGYYAP